MNSASPPTDLEFPLRLGSQEDFSRVMSVLRGPHFDPSAIQAILQDFGLYGGASEPHGKNGTEKHAGGAGNALLNLFVRLESVPKGALEAMLDRPALGSFLSLDLIRVDPEDDSQYVSPVFVYPVGNLIIVSDHYKRAGGLPPDSVFPAVEPGALQFVRLLPQHQTGDALDLCSGTGIGALVLSPHARHVVASDVTARATHFAHFNRLLNNCQNVEALQGDLYQGVGGRTFDFIAAHAPFMPSLRDASIWRDAGPTGSALLQRIIQDLPQFLRPNGEFLCVCMGGETDKVPFQNRVRGWLGGRQNEFDIILASQKYHSPQQVAQVVAGQHSAVSEDSSYIRELESAFLEAGITRFVYGALAMRRHGEPGGKPQSLRTQLSTKTDGASFRWAFHWNEQASQPDLKKHLSGLRPRLAPDLLVRVAHRVENSQLVPFEYIMETDWPFSHTTKFEPGIVPLLARLNGKLSLIDLFRAAKQERAIPAAYELESFLALIAMQLGRGYLTVPGGVPATAS